MQFINNFFTLVAAITALTKKRGSIWPEEVVKAFELLKEAFISAGVFQHPYSTLPSLVEVYASQIDAQTVLPSEIMGPPTETISGTPGLHPLQYKLHPHHSKKATKKRAQKQQKVLAKG